MAGKDRRLYAKIDIGFDEHDKIYPLSDAAFRALVEATLYARRQLTDGFLAERLAVKRWGVEVLEELSTNDPARPSLVRVEGGWQIHDFAEHQTTRDEIEALTEARREAGRRGGQAKAQARLNHAASKPVASARQVPEQTASKTYPETETETETVSSKELTTRGSRVPDSFAITDEMRSWAAKEVPLVDLDKKLGEWIDYWRAVPGKGGVKLDWVGTWRNGMRKQQEFAERDGVKNQPRKVKVFNDEVD